MWGRWAGYDGQSQRERPLFYHAASDTALEAAEGMESEARAVVAALSAAVGLPQPPATLDIRSSLQAYYGPAIGDASSLGSLLRTNAAYKVRLS